MKTTIDIPDATMDEAMKFTGANRAVQTLQQVLALATQALPASTTKVTITAPSTSVTGAVMPTAQTPPPGVQQ